MAIFVTQIKLYLIMAILQYDDLENIINTYIDRSSKYGTNFMSYLLLLKNTGMRPVEALESFRIFTHDINYLYFQPSKNNNLRKLDISTIPDTFINYYLNQSVTYKSYYYRRYLRLFKQHISKRQYICDNRNVDLYLFRYYYVRKLYVDGMNFPEIKLHMGWKNENIPMRYVLRNITSL